jgi:predicted O-methyltransferase YrrM
MDSARGRQLFKDLRGLRRLVARSRFAGVAAFPVRSATVLRYDARVVRRSVSWLICSREHTNFTYELTDRNREHLAWWVSAVTASPVDQVREYIEELHSDEELRSHIEHATEASDRRRLADDEVRYRRRAGWYAAVRAIKPNLVVETGTGKGLGSCVFAAALLRNGRGRLISVDVNPESGYLIDGRYAAVVERVIGDSVTFLHRMLHRMNEPVDLFLHDSWHTFQHETAELNAVRFATGAVVLSDNAHGSDALLVFAQKTGRRFLFFREEPRDHWYPGDGIGAAY